MGAAILALLLSGGREGRADFMFSTSPGDGGTLSFGPTLVGYSSSQSITATYDTVNGDWSVGNGVFGAAQGSAAISPSVATLFNLGVNDDGSAQSASQTYTYSPTVRGTDSATVQVWYGTNPQNDQSGQNADGNAAANITLNGQGVAPVNSVTKTDAGLTRIGTSSTASISVSNVGDGNQSGLGTISNLNGSAGAATATANRFTGSGGSFSLGDSGSQTFSYQYTPTDHKQNTATVLLNFDDGSSDGTNSSQLTSVALSGQGVGPTFASSHAPGSVLNFGKVEAGSSGNMSLGISNSSTDANGGNQSLTNLTVLSAFFTGPDASLFSLTNFTGGTVLRDGNLDKLNLSVNFNPENTAEGWKDAYLTLVTDQGAAFGEAGDTFTFHVRGFAANPEPSTLTLLGTGVVCLAGYGWRRRRRTTA